MQGDETREPISFPEDDERAKLKSRAVKGDVAAAEELAKLERWEGYYWEYIRDNIPKFPPVRSGGWNSCDD